ncbi:MAG: hypothetical protein M3Q99_06635 [Acidobacteriota bacterium]|nr:hypothetical protein [Acidobacteriota bacterium]
MMTTTEILKEIYRLPVNQQQELKEKLLKETESNESAKPQITEKEFLQQLFDEGFISYIPEEMTDEDDDFEPIEIEGEPISETIIQERR